MEVISARILRDCPVENSGPCPVIACEECPDCIECEELEAPALGQFCPECPLCSTVNVPSTTALTTTTTLTAPTTTCPPCICSNKALKECEESRSFTTLSKDGAQGSRTTWEEEAGRLTKVLDQEKNSTKTYQEKYDEVKKVLVECEAGYGRANDSLEFALKLVNDHSGRANLCEETAKGFQNLTRDLSLENEICSNETTRLKGLLEKETRNYPIWPLAQRLSPDFDRSDKGIERH